MRTLTEIVEQVFGKPLDRCETGAVAEHATYTVTPVRPDSAGPWFAVHLLPEPSHAGPDRENQMHVQRWASENRIGMPLRHAEEGVIVVEQVVLTEITADMFDEALAAKIAEVLRKLHHGYKGPQLKQGPNRVGLVLQFGAEAGEKLKQHPRGGEILAAAKGLQERFAQAPVSAVCHLNLRPEHLKIGIDPSGAVLLDDFQCAALEHPWVDLAKLVSELGLDEAKRMMWAGAYLQQSAAREALEDLVAMAFIEAAMTFMYNVAYDRPPEEWYQRALELMPA